MVSPRRGKSSCRFPGLYRFCYSESFVRLQSVYCLSKGPNLLGGFSLRYVNLLGFSRAVLATYKQFTFCLGSKFKVSIT